MQKVTARPWLLTTSRIPVFIIRLLSAICLPRKSRHSRGGPLGWVSLCTQTLVPSSHKYSIHVGKRLVSLSHTAPSLNDADQVCVNSKNPKQKVIHFGRPSVHSPSTSVVLYRPSKVSLPTHVILGSQQLGWSCLYVHCVLSIKTDLWENAVQQWLYPLWFFSICEALGFI